MRVHKHTNFFDQDLDLAQELEGFLVSLSGMAGIDQADEAEDTEIPSFLCLADAHEHCKGRFVALGGSRRNCSCRCHKPKRA